MKTYIEPNDKDERQAIVVLPARSSSHFIIGILAVLSFVTGCNVQDTGNTLTADAGVDRIAKVGNYMILAANSLGSFSGRPRTYTWTASPANPTHPTFDRNSEQIVIGLAASGTYEFSLSVSDGVSESGPDFVKITVNERDHWIFSDPALEIQVRYALMCPGDTLTDVRLRSLDTLYGWFWLGKAASLSGIERCVNLTHFSGLLNNISDLTPLSSLSQLRELNLSQNYLITNLEPLSGLSSLTQLDLSENKIIDISALGELTSLTSLDLGYNSFHDISPLRNLTRLKDLRLGFTDLADISVISELGLLEILWMPTSNVSDISPVSTLHNLKVIHVGANHIQDINVLVNAPDLERVYLDGNEIRDISVLERLQKLEVADLHDNEISNLLPLVNNTNFIGGSLLTIYNNPLDSVSVQVYIPQLRARGVSVIW